MESTNRLESARKSWADKNDLHMHNKKLLIAAAFEFFEPGLVKGYYFDEASSLVDDRVKEALEEAIEEKPEASVKEIVAGYSCEDAKRDLLRYDGENLINRLKQTLGDQTSAAA